MHGIERIITKFEDYGWSQLPITNDSRAYSGVYQGKLNLSTISEEHLWEEIMHLYLDEYYKNDSTRGLSKENNLNHEFEAKLYVAMATSVYGYMYTPYSAIDKFGTVLMGRYNAGKDGSRYVYMEYWEYNHYLNIFRTNVINTDYNTFKGIDNFGLDGLISILSDY